MSPKEKATARQKVRRMVSTERCAKCGDTRYLDRHHIDGRLENGTLENIIVLCRDCHVREHRIMNDQKMFSRLQSLILLYNSGL